MSEGPPRTPRPGLLEHLKDGFLQVDEGLAAQSIEAQRRGVVSAFRPKPGVERDLSRYQRSDLLPAPSALDLKQAQQLTGLCPTAQRVHAQAGDGVPEVAAPVSGCVDDQRLGRGGIERAVVAEALPGHHPVAMRGVGLEAPRNRLPVGPGHRVAGAVTAQLGGHATQVAPHQPRRAELPAVDVEGRANTVEQRPLSAFEEQENDRAFLSDEDFVLHLTKQAVSTPQLDITQLRSNQKQVVIKIERVE